MRVIAGTFRGRPLTAPAGDATRPTSDRVREALFSMIAALDPPTLDGGRVLDLFAGSGALGIEALSRGAASAVFVDPAAPAITAVRGNLERLGLTAELHRTTAERFLGIARTAADQYDLVFLDPPYRLAGLLSEPLSTRLPDILARDARVVVESDHREPLKLDLPIVRERRYGDTVITIHDAR